MNVGEHDSQCELKDKRKGKKKSEGNGTRQ